MALIEDRLLSSVGFGDLAFGVVSVPKKFSTLVSPEELRFGKIGPLRVGGEAAVLATELRKDGD